MTSIASSKFKMMMQLMSLRDKREKSITTYFKKQLSNNLKVKEVNYVNMQNKILLWNVKEVARIT